MFAGGNKDAFLQDAYGPLIDHIGGGACMAGRVCMVGGHVWQGACVAGGHAWQGLCVAGGHVWHASPHQ